MARALRPGNAALPTSALLPCASVLALLAGAGDPACAASPPVFSPSWFGVTAAARQAGPSVARMQPGTGIPANSVRQVQQSIADLSRAAQAVAQARAAQAQAVQAQARSGAGPAGGHGVPDGLTIGGLQVAPGVSAAGSPLWLGAAMPTQRSAGTTTAVTVAQNRPNAVLTWKTFNVGASTTLHFDQSAGGAAANSWVVLNRVDDPAAQPSRILGSITAPGEVLVLNRNGILFGAGSQINVNALVASTAEIRGAKFLASGVFDAKPSFTGATSGIVVEAGAAITTNPPQTAVDRGGFVWLLGSSVRNDGAITTDNGQTILAAGRDFLLRPGFNMPGNPIATTLGAEIAVDGGGAVVNSGLIRASTGDVTLVGQTVLQAGAIVATTSVGQRGSVHLLTDKSDAASSVTLAPSSTTIILADPSGATAIDAQRATFLAQSKVNDALRFAATGPALLNNEAALADRQDQGRVEITTGGTVSFRSASLTLVTGGQIAVSAKRRVFAETGARLDVAGSLDVALPASANTLTVNLQGYELRDSAANRDRGVLASQTVHIDAGQLVTVARGANTYQYTTGGLVEVSGELGNLGHGIREWTVPGGAINLAGAEVVAQPGAVFNLAGGSVRYRPGMVPTSWLYDAAGRLYSVDTAPANIAYAGVYGGFAVDHVRWGIKDLFASPLVAPGQVFRAGYSVGRDAGSLTLSAPSAVFEARIDAAAVVGERQSAARPAEATDPYLFTQATAPLPGSLALANYSLATGAPPYATDVRIGAAAPLAASLDAATPLPGDRRNTALLAAGLINAAGLGGLAIATAGSIAIEAPIRFAAGAQVTLAAPSTRVSAAITARGGSVAIGNRYANALAGGFIEAASGVDVTLSPQASIDTRGVFTNRLLDPYHFSGEAFVNGGAVTIHSSQQVVLAPGSAIDASSGGVVRSSQKSLGGQGGAISITAYDPTDPNPVVPAAEKTVRLAAALRSYGSTKGGGLSLSVPSVFIAEDASPAPPGAVTLRPAFFGAGFSDYAILGYDGVTVAPGARIIVTEPVYRFGAASLRAASGADPAAAFDLLLPERYIADPAAAVLTPRQGAGIALRSVLNAGSSAAAGGSIVIGADAAITVDAKARIVLEAFGQITVEGALVAPGGAIAVLNDRAQANQAGQSLTYQPGLSIWLGAGSVLDVSARAATALDRYGRPYGIVPAGGSLLLGSAGGTLHGAAVSTDAFIITRPGARLDASGASAVLDRYAGTTTLLSTLHADAAPNQAVLVASEGGSITLNTESGADLQGGMRAAAGGAGAQGGRLSLTLLTPPFLSAEPVHFVPDALRLARDIVVGQSVLAATLPADLKPGDPASPFVPGRLRLAAEQVSAGGFDTLAVAAGDLITFDGAVTLRAGRAIHLAAGTIGTLTGAGGVSIVAPYVALTGLNNDNPGGSIFRQFRPQGSFAPSPRSTAATLTVAAGTIDVAGNLAGGISEPIALEALAADGSATTRLVERRGFAKIALVSAGDLRFLPGPAGSRTSLITPGDLALTAGQIYPTAGANAYVTAGFDYTAMAAAANPYLPGGVITIARSPGPTPPAPLTAGGILRLQAGRIDQGGVLRAPEGQLTLGALGTYGSGAIVDSAFTYAVNLLAGSITSVSAAGLTIPYGGTADGVTYTVNGAPVALLATLPPPGIAIFGQTLNIGAGATLDLSGGGRLAGAAFIFGRGGSTDILTAPLLSLTSANTVTAPPPAANPVYAIVPSANPSVAPPVSTAAAYTGSLPAVGEQIAIGDGVPGLPAGTYTLLPGSDALLPGGFRVELNTARAGLLTGARAVGNGSYRINGYRGVANTAFRDPLPVAMTVSPGAAVRSYAQYNEGNFSQYAAARAALFGQPRVALAEDAKQLVLGFPATLAAPGSAPGPPFSQHGTVLFQPAAGGYGGTAIVAAGTDLEVVADGAAARPGSVALRASDLNRLSASTLSLGGYAALSNFGSVINFQLGAPGNLATNTPSVALRSGAVLGAAQAFLVGGPGGITVERGAGINTLGLGAPGRDSSNGFVYSNNNLAVLAVSNADLAFLPAVAAYATGPIAIGTCAPGACSGTTRLYGERTLALVTAGGVTLDPAARYGARAIDLAVASVNIGTTAALAGANLRSGLTLDSDILGRLLGGDPATGAPAVQKLVLTANQSINFYGSIDLTTVDPATGRSSLRQLQFNTPAIYGAGSAADAVTLTTGTFTWNGLSAYDATGALVSVPPGGIVAGGAGTGAGRFALRAERIVLGYGAADQPDNLTRRDRLMLGFAEVTLTGDSLISANNRGSLSVYQSQGAAFSTAGGFARTGGNLTLVTPLLTGAAGGVNAITAGGALRLLPPAGAPAAGPPAIAAPGALGAEIDLAGSTIDAATAITLPGGKLAMTAAGDLTLGAGSRIDLGGRRIQLFDQTRYSFGGDVKLTSAAGNLVQQAGASIDVSAIGADAGGLTITAAAPGAGRVTLGGAILGGTTGGGTIGGGAGSGFAAGSFDVRAQSLDFGAINATLNAGGVVGSRSFDIRTGDLTIGDGLAAHKINISVDAGSLTVTGTIAAGGAQPGSIRLAARDGLTLTGTAVLDAHGSRLRVDSAGQPIAAANRGEVELTSSGAGSVLSLAGGAVIDLSTPDGASYGTVILNAPRAGPDDIGIAATGPVTIRGAAGIALNGFRRYRPADGAGTITQADLSASLPGSVNLDAIHADSTAFLGAAGANAGLVARLAGLTRYGAAFHLRPGVEIDSAPGGNLTVQGDLNLSGYRYAVPVAPKRLLTEPGALVLRAANNLRVFGSITDGFGPPPDPGRANPDDNGWLLSGGTEINGSDIVLSTFVILLGSTDPNVVAAGGATMFSNRANTALTYDINVYVLDTTTNLDPFYNPIPTVTGAVVLAGLALPAPMTLAARIDGTDMVVPAGTVLTAPITLASGAVFPAGTIVAAPSGLVLPAGTVLGAGSRLPIPVTLAPGSRWPAGASLADFAAPVLLSANTAALAPGSLIPAGTSLALDTPSSVAGGASCVNFSCSTRPFVNGVQGTIHAIAPLLGTLADGSLPQSWSMRLVGGADLAGADTRRVAPPADLPAASPSDPSPGSIVLSDLHYQLPFGSPIQPGWSVIRTGTGDLELLAGGDVRQGSLYGIYTAGAPTPVGAGFTLPRGTAADGTILGGGSAYEALVSGGNYRAYYPDHGGNVLISAQGSVRGNILVPQTATGFAATNGVGNWLWRQGGGGGDTAWWINFGTYALPLDNTGVALSAPPALTGFTGIGALGGGNVTILAGGDIGAIQPGAGGSFDHSQALDLAIGSSGRVIAGGNGQASTILTTGGGDLTVRAGGAINPTGSLTTSGSQGPTGYPSADTALGGTITDLRGQIRIRAASVGQVVLQYNQNNPYDPRAGSPYAATAALSQGGPILVPGDGGAAISARGDLVLGGVGDATRLPGQNLTPAGIAAAPGQSAAAAAGLTWFSLWQPGTSIELFSAGGNVTPSTQSLASSLGTPGAASANSLATGNRFLYPPVLDVVAASGSLYYGVAAAPGASPIAPSGIELAPSAAGGLRMLAGGSIHANQYGFVSGAYPQTIAISGADPAGTATPLNPAYRNVLLAAPAGSPTVLSLFAFGPDTASGTLHIGDTDPARFYAGQDIVNLRFGEIVSCNDNTCGYLSALRLVAAKAVQVRAGRDIVDFGPALGDPVPAQQTSNEKTTGNLVLNNNPTDASVLSAGRDILYVNLQSAGPGLLYVAAGRNLYQADQGVLESIGTLNPNGQTRNGGAGITVLAGVGPNGPDFFGFAAAYLNPANQRASAGASGVIQTYADRLLAFLRTRYGYRGSAAEAPGFFQALPAEQQSPLLLAIYFDELRASGREFTDAAGPRYRSYARGREAIAALFPGRSTYQGDLTLFGGSGIRTDFGGAIQLLTPGGQTVLGVTSGPQPPATAGVLTQGQGDIGIYSLGSVLLGQSRVFTTFGGGIVIWSATGDVNAGRGSKSTAVYTPSRIVYDNYGNISLAPSVPTAGAGIATLSPIPGTAAGDVDLIAPLGTIDAGEAGIRVSGNVNLSALSVTNASNVQVQGKSSGLPSVAAPNVGALSAATAAAASATQAAQQSAQNSTPASRRTPSTITVEVTGYGG